MMVWDISGQGSTVFQFGNAFDWGILTMKREIKARTFARRGEEIC